MKTAADCNNTKACFPAAIIYCAVVGMTSRGISDDFWIQMCVIRQEFPGINPLTVASEFVSITRSSAESQSFVAEIIANPFSDSSWVQMCVREMGGYESILSLKNFSP